MANNNFENEECEVAAAEFVRKRITELRLKKDVSEYQMSYDLGHSRNYIRSITSGESLPKMSQFHRICDYFGITPGEFYEPYLKKKSESDLFHHTVSMLKHLDEDALTDINRIVGRIIKNKE